MKTETIEIHAFKIPERVIGKFRQSIFCDVCGKRRGEGNHAKEELRSKVSILALSILAVSASTLTGQTVSTRLPLPKVVIMPKPETARAMFTPKPVAVSMPKPAEDPRAVKLAGK